MVCAKSAFQRWHSIRISLCLQRVPVEPHFGHQWKTTMTMIKQQPIFRMFERELSMIKKLKIYLNNKLNKTKDKNIQTIL